jgi:hypothetical protein
MSAVERPVGELTEGLDDLTFALEGNGDWPWWYRLASRCW